MNFKLIFLYLLFSSSLIYSENNSVKQDGNVIVDDSFCKKPFITRSGGYPSDDLIELMFLAVKTFFECFLDNQSSIEESRRISRENEMQNRVTRSNFGDSDLPNIKFSYDQVNEISKNQDDNVVTDDSFCKKPLIARNGGYVSDELIDLMFFAVKTAFECFLDNQSSIEESCRVSRENDMRDKGTRSNFGSSDLLRINFSDDQLREIAEKLSTSFCEKLKKYNP